MPLLANAKHEQFCQHIVNGLSQTSAYEAAGYQRSPTGASQLAQRPEIQNRIQELTAEKKGIIQELGDDIDNLPSELNRDWLLRTLMKNVAIAQKAEQIAPANKAIEMIAELIGLSIKKPGSAGKPDETNDDGSKPDINVDRMLDGMSKLGEVLARKEEKQVADPDE